MAVPELRAVGGADAGSGGRRPGGWGALAGAMGAEAASAASPFASATVAGSVMTPPDGVGVPGLAMQPLAAVAHVLPLPQRHRLSEASGASGSKGGTPGAPNRSGGSDAGAGRGRSRALRPMPPVAGPASGALPKESSADGGAGADEGSGARDFQQQVGLKRGTGLTAPLPLASRVYCVGRHCSCCPAPQCPCCQRPSVAISGSLHR
jgi:hypothetical protein